MKNEIKNIYKIIPEEKRGSLTQFSILDIFKSILIIGEQNNIGRNALAINLSIGPGAIRTLIKKLQNVGLIDVQKTGISLSPDGIIMYKNFKKKIQFSKEINVGNLSLGTCNYIILIRKTPKILPSSLDLRDSAIRGGSKGAMFIHFQNNKFLIPNGPINCEKDFPDTIWKKFRSELKPSDGDLIIISGADNIHAAEYGALSSVINLFR